MRGFLLALWLLVPALAGAYHYGPGQERLRLDETQSELATAVSLRTHGMHEGAAESFTAALGQLPAERVDETNRIRVERAKSMLLAKQLPEAYDELATMLPELLASSDTDPKVLADARETFANAKYYLAWLMRKEGEPREAWEPEIEGSRQLYKLLAEEAEAAGDEAALTRHQEDLEAAIRLARLDLSELQALPLPSQCKGCCSGNCKCKGNKKGKGKGKSQKKKQGDEQARGASSGPPPDDGGN